VLLYQPLEALCHDRSESYGTIRQVIVCFLVLVVVVLEHDGTISWFREMLRNVRQYHGQLVCILIEHLSRYNVRPCCLLDVDVPQFPADISCFQTGCQPTGTDFCSGVVSKLPW